MTHKISLILISFTGSLRKTRPRKNFSISQTSETASAYSLSATYVAILYFSIFVLKFYRVIPRRTAFRDMLEFRPGAPG
ncbi:hypothetical protein JW964_13680 [candidate division KSB1 bacterium]|nr:hypothetical protein [candidate division KSB1 bacterium]